MRHTEFLVELGKQFVNEYNTENLVCAFAGGSVGRGDADEFSDLDVNFYTIDTQSSNKNVEFRGIIIQLNIEPLPKLKSIVKSPWEYRFLQESRVLYDPDDIFHDLQSKAIHYFNSTQGKKLLKIQSKEIVNKRITWAEESIERKEWITAGTAARSAWVDAGFAYSFFAADTLSTGKLLSVMDELDKYRDIRELFFEHIPYDIEKILGILKNYRSYLFRNYGNHFGLHPIQDKIIRRKIERYEQMKDSENIKFHVYGEAFGCILSANGPFEKHINNLPIEHKDGLSLLGFRKYGEHEINAICNQAKEIKRMII
jgi:predicted nucleotidyltransferase